MSDDVDYAEDFDEVSPDTFETKMLEPAQIAKFEDDIYGDDFEDGQKSEKPSPITTANHKDPPLSFAKKMPPSNDNNRDGEVDNDDANEKNKEAYDIHTDLPTPNRSRRLSRGGSIGGSIGESGRRDSLGSMGGEDWQNLLEEPSNISGCLSVDDGDNYLLKMAGTEFICHEDMRAPTEEENQQTLDKILSDTVESSNTASLLAIAREKKVDIGSQSRPASATAAAGAPFARISEVEGLETGVDKPPADEIEIERSDDEMDDFILRMNLDSGTEGKSNSHQQLDVNNNSTPPDVVLEKPIHEVPVEAVQEKASAAPQASLSSPSWPSEKPTNTKEKNRKRASSRRGSLEELAAIDSFLQQNAPKIRSRSNSSSITPRITASTASRPSSASLLRPTSASRKDKQNDADDISQVDNFLRQNSSSDLRLRASSKMYTNQNQAEVKDMIRHLTEETSSGEKKGGGGGGGAKQQQQPEGETAQDQDPGDDEVYSNTEEGAGGGNVRADEKQEQRVEDDTFGRREDIIAAVDVDADEKATTIAAAGDIDVDGVESDSEKAFESAGNLQSSPSKEAWPEKAITELSHHQILGLGETETVSATQPQHITQSEESDITATATATAATAIAVVSSRQKDEEITPGIAVSVAATAADSTDPLPQRKASTSAQALREHVQKMRSATTATTAAVDGPNLILGSVAEEDAHTAAHDPSLPPAAAAAVTTDIHAPRVEIVHKATALAPVVRPASAVAHKQQKKEGDEVMEQIRKQTDRMTTSSDSSNKKKVVTTTDNYPSRKDRIMSASAAAAGRRPNTGTGITGNQPQQQIQELPRKPPIPRPASAAPVRRQNNNNNSNNSGGVAPKNDKETEMIADQTAAAYRKEFFVRNPSNRTMGEDDAAHHHKAPINVSPEMQDTVILLRMLRKKAIEAKQIIKEADAKWRAKLTESLDEAVAELKSQQNNEARMAGLDVKVVSSQLKSLEASAIPIPTSLVITAAKPVPDIVISEYKKKVELAESCEREKRRLEREELQLRNKLSWIHKRHQEECERLSQALNEPIHRLDLVQDGLLKDIEGNVESVEVAVEHAARVQEVIPANTQDIILRKRRAGAVAKAYSALRNSFRSLADQCAAIPEVYSQIDMQPGSTASKAAKKTTATTATNEEQSRRGGAPANTGTTRKTGVRGGGPVTSAISAGPGGPNLTRALSAQRMCAKSVDQLRALVSCQDPYDSHPHQLLSPKRPQSASLAKAILMSVGVPYIGYKDVRNNEVAATSRKKKAKRRAKKRRSKSANRPRSNRDDDENGDNVYDDDEEAGEGDALEDYDETGDDADGYRSEARDIGADESNRRKPKVRRDKEDLAAAGEYEQDDDNDEAEDETDRKKNKARPTEKQNDAASSAEYDEDFEQAGDDDGGEEFDDNNDAADGDGGRRKKKIKSKNKKSAVTEGGERDSGSNGNGGDDDDEYKDYFEDDSGEESLDLDHVEAGEQGTMMNDRQTTTAQAKDAEQGTARRRRSSTGRSRSGISRTRQKHGGEDRRIMSGPFDKDVFFRDTVDMGGNRPSSRIRARLADPFYATGLRLRPQSSSSSQAAAAGGGGGNRHSHKQHADDEFSWNPIPCFCCGRKYKGKGKLIPNNCALDRNLVNEFREKQEAHIATAIRNQTVSYKQQVMLEDRAFLRARYGHDKPEQKLFCSWECMKHFIALCLPPQQKYYTGILIDLAAGYVVESKTVYTQGDTGIGRLT